MSKYFAAILFYPSFGLIGLIVASFGVRNGNISAAISDTAILYMLFSFGVAGWVIYVLSRAVGTSEPAGRPPGHVLPVHLHMIFAGLVAVTCLPLLVYGPPIFTGLNRYQFANLDFVTDLRQLDNAITWVLVASLAVHVSPRTRTILWSILMVVAFCYGDKFSPLARIAFSELVIRLYWRESIRERSAVVLGALLAVFMLGGVTIYWWTGTLSGLLSGFVERVGKQASCTIAVSEIPGFMKDQASIFWNFFEAQATGKSFFHEVSRAISLRSDQSVLGDSFPCVYMAMSPDVFTLTGLLVVSTAIKVLLLKFAFVFLEKVNLGLASVLIFFLYVRYLDSVIASDKFHLLIHPVFLFSAYFMLLMIVAKWRRQLSYD